MGGAARGRSAIERLEPALREAVDMAIASGASIDEITALICESGGTCSRSAVGRYARRSHDLIQRRYEARRIVELWERKGQEGGEDGTGRVGLEALRSLALMAVADVSASGEPVTGEVLARLALALRRIEATDKLREERERAKGEGRTRRPGRAAGRPLDRDRRRHPRGRRGKGLGLRGSLRRRALVCSVPSDAGRWFVQFPQAPGAVCSFPSIAGRELRSLGSALRARRSRAGRAAVQPGPYQGRLLVPTYPTYPT